MKHVRAHAVGLRHKGEHLIKGMCPPYYDSMDEAIDEVLRSKFGEGGIYQDEALFARIYKQDYGSRYLAEAAEYGGTVVECVRDICNYIYDTHGRFPAHCEAVHAPGIWLQAHHVETDYYERFLRHGLTDVHRSHDEDWHATEAEASAGRTQHLRPPALTRRSG